MKKINLLIVSILMSFSAFSQQLISITPLYSYNLATVQSYTNMWDPSNLELHPVESYKVTYNTTDVHGEPTVASGAVYIPTLTDCEYAPILAYEHGTEFNRNNVPSTNKYKERGIYFSTTGYITVMPDYLGLGDNPGVHLFQHAETEATATLDLVRAVRQYLDTASNQLKDNGQFFITGYSQGGHSAMATNKYIEENALTNEFEVVACAPLSGAYDQTGAQLDLILDGDSVYFASPFLPVILGSYQEAYGNLYQSYDEIYKASHASQIETYLNAGTYSMMQWVGMLGTNHYVFMQDTVLQNVLADTDRDTHPINKALRANNVYDWVPQNPVRMLYCDGDDMVYHYSSLNTLDTMLALGATEVEAINIFPTGDHNSCFVPATKDALNWFNTLAVKCSYASVKELNETKITIYPNPTNNILTVEGIEFSNSNVEIHSSIGQSVDAKFLGVNQIDVNELPSGIYFLTISSNDNAIFKRLKFVKE